MAEELIAYTQTTVPAQWVEIISCAANVRGAEFVVESPAHGVRQANEFSEAAAGLKECIQQARLDGAPQQVTFDNSRLAGRTTDSLSI